MRMTRIALRCLLLVLALWYLACFWAEVWELLQAHFMAQVAIAESLAGVRSLP